MKTLTLVIILLSSALPAVAQEKMKESAYERVMRTGTIRCGYFLFPPLAVKDPNTNILSGITVDIFNKMGANMGLKVDWVEEVSFAGLVPGLQTNRYDVICTPMWPTSARAREVEFSEPEFYAALGVWVRADDHRFDNAIESINSPDITITGVDGQIEQTVRDEQFPRAKMMSMPGGTDFTQQMMNIVTGKADVTFVDKAAGELFEQAHPGQIRNIAANSPLRVFPFSIAVAGGEIRFKNMLDVAVHELNHTGYIERKLKEYDPKGLFLPVAKPYKSSE